MPSTEDHTAPTAERNTAADVAEAETNPVGGTDAVTREDEDNADEESSFLPKNVDWNKLLPAPALDDEERRNWHWRAQMIVGFSLVFNIFVFVTALSAGLALDSGALLGLATEALIDVMDDMVCVWRFFCDPHDPQNIRYDAQGAVLIAFIVILSGILSIAHAIFALSAAHPPKIRESMLIMMAMISTVSFLMAIVKFIIASKLDSQVMYLDAFMTTSVAAIGISYLISAAVYIKDPEHMWWLDNVIAMMVALLILLYAVRVLFQNKGFMNRSFWDLPFQGGGADFTPWGGDKIQASGGQRRNSAPGTNPSGNTDANKHE